jgi:hypothetical protein
MTASTTYYAILSEDSEPGRPAGVLRRVKSNGGQIDEIYSHNLAWEFSPLLYSAERGDTLYEFTEISEEEADRIVARIRDRADRAE